MPADVFDADGLRRLARSAEAFRVAALAWLEVHETRSDISRSGTRPTVRQFVDANPGEVSRLAAEVERWAQDAETAIDLTGRFVPQSDAPGRNAAREWSTMTSKGTVNASELDIYGTAGVLEELAGRGDRGISIFPVQDPRILHPYVWCQTVVSQWIKEDYSAIPASAAEVVSSSWAHRIALAQAEQPRQPQYPDGARFWQGLFSAQAPAERQPRLRVPDYGDPERTAARQHALGEALSGLDALSGGYRRLFGREGGTPTLQMDQVAGWLHAWSTLAFLLEECTLFLPESHAPEPTPAPAV
ncbi:MAG: hypothetical protein IE926_00395, partial [Micrococcales bacterium]|nr:hypothetical protein [Micrococcales bacterium]